MTFAKYGKKGMFYNGPAIMETDMEKKPVGGNEKSMSYTRDGRSFKEVVQGWPQHPKGGDQMWRISRELEASNDDEVRRQLEKVKVKEMVWRLAEEFFNANNLEEIKHHLGTLREGVIHAVKAETPCYRQYPVKNSKRERQSYIYHYILQCRNYCNCYGTICTI